MFAAIVLLSLGVGSIWAAVVRLSSGTWSEPVRQAGNWVLERQWAETTLVVIAGVVALVGLILLFFAVSPGRPSAMWITSSSTDADDDVTEVVMSRRSVARLARSRADEIDGVDSVSSTVGGRKVSLSVTTPSEKRDDIQRLVTSAVEEALRSVGLDPMPRVATKARTRNP